MDGCYYLRITVPWPLEVRDSQARRFSWPLSVHNSWRGWRCVALLGHHWGSAIAKPATRCRIASGGEVNGGYQIGSWICINLQVILGLRLASGLLVQTIPWQDTQLHGSSLPTPRARLNKQYTSARDFIPPWRSRMGTKNSANSRANSWW